jgi:hypothetical protein
LIRSWEQEEKGKKYKKKGSIMVRRHAFSFDEMM